MLSTTLQAITAILRCDPSVSDEDRRRLILQLRCKNQPAKAAAREPRLLHRREVARRLGVSLRTLDKLHNQGVLRKLKFPGRVRSVGILTSELNQLLGVETAPASVTASWPEPKVDSLRS